MGSTRLSVEVMLETLRLVAEHGTVSAAARASGIPRDTIQSRYDKAKIRGVKLEINPADNIKEVVPDGQQIRGVSTLLNSKGEIVGQWVKTKEDENRLLEKMREAVDALKSDLPAAAPVQAPESCIEDLVSSYTLTDYHIGMMASAAEAGEEWSTEKSENFLVRWFAAAIAAAPASKVGILCQLGDFFHFDSLDPVTPTSHHVLDADCRYQDMVTIGVRVLRVLIRMLLEKHEKVHVIMAEGNHDIASSVWLRVMFKEFYRDDPRVTVDDSASPYYAFEWGLTSLFFHHGHKRGLKDLSKVFTSIYREIFGRTKFSYGHMGHMHHTASKEDGLMIVHQHPTMASKDAYAARGGYVANRGASVITYSKLHGEVSRITIRPEMVTA